MDKKQRLLNEIYETSFAVNDLTLFLDTHPYDSQALAMFNSLNQRRQNALKAFERDYYPLTIDSMSDNSSSWTWGSAPAPWNGGETNVEL